MQTSNSDALKVTAGICLAMLLMTFVGLYAVNTKPSHGTTADAPPALTTTNPGAPRQISAAEAQRLADEAVKREQARVNPPPPETKPYRMQGDNIYGTFTNHSGRHMSLLKVTFSLYDFRGRKVGEAWDFLSSLDAGETWSYKCHVFNSIEVSKFRLDDIDYVLR